MESFALSFASMLLALAIVLGLAYVVLRVMRARLQPRAGAGGAADDGLRFVRALPVGTKERVVIVEHRGERWMLGVTGGGISTIAHWPAGAAHSEAPAAVPPAPPAVAGSVGSDPD
jgi:flagellar protein FliO/FliZ